LWPDLSISHDEQLKFEKLKTFEDIQQTVRELQKPTIFVVLSVPTLFGGHPAHPTCFFEGNVIICAPSLRKSRLKHPNQSTEIHEI
jgi:dephospho-CoA kinase